MRRFTLVDAPCSYFDTFVAECDGEVYLGIQVMGSNLSNDLVEHGCHRGHQVLNA